MVAAMVGMMSLGVELPVYAQYNQQEAQKAEEEADKSKEVIPEQKPESKPFSVAGNGEVLDDISDDDTKQFITVRTKNNQTFFVVIDRANTIDNVYMLSLIDEDDLAEFLDKEDEAEGGLPTVQIPGNGDGTVSAEGNAEGTDGSEVEVPEKKKSGNGMLFAIIGFLALFAAGYYYFRIYKPKQKRGSASMPSRQQERDPDEDAEYEDDDVEDDEDYEDNGEDGDEDYEDEYEDDGYEEDSEEEEQPEDEEADDETVSETVDNTEDYYDEEDEIEEEPKPARRRRRRRK